MIDDLRIKNAILEEKLMQKMKQARYYKKKYLEDHRKIKEVREYIEEMNVWCIEFENFGVESKGLLEILDKEKENGDN